MVYHDAICAHIPSVVVPKGRSKMLLIQKSTSSLGRLLQQPKSLSAALFRKSFSNQQTVRRLAKQQFSERPQEQTLNSLPPFASSALKTFSVLGHVHSTLSGVYDRLASSRYGKLMRLDKPAGTHLLFLPGAWSISMAAPSVPDWLHLIGLFYAGSVILRGAGCTINDIWDADVDRQVARTRDRPIASGAVSTSSAFVFLGAQLCGGLVILSYLNEQSFLLASLSVLPVIFYPFAKRHTLYPQAALAFTFNWGALLGSTAAVGVVTPECALLYSAGWCWTMVYDTIYAHQDKRDDSNVGVSSTALTFGNNTKAVLALFASGKVALLSCAGIVGNLSWPYFLCVGASGMHIANLISNTDLDNGEQCADAFKSNVTAGMLTAIGVILGRIV